MKYEDLDVVYTDEVRDDEAIPEDVFEKIKEIEHGEHDTV